jgi:NADH:ubiquinone oxidoreductase subunit K
MPGTSFTAINGCTADLICIASYCLVDRNALRSVLLSVQVCQWVFGQEFPAADSSLRQQVFAVFTAVIGLAAFALVLAVVEQVVLEGMEANVKRGSHVYESGHVSTFRN